MGRGDQLVRQWSILAQLSHGERSRRALAQSLGVSRKTIARDIDALSMFPIYASHQGIDVVYGLLRESPPPQLHFKPDERAALLLSKPTLLAAVADAPFQRAFESALAKIELLQQAATQQARHQRPSVFQSDFHKPHIRFNAFPEQLIEAALHHRTVQIRYFTASRQAISDRVVEPYVLRLHPSGYTLIAYCHRRQAFLNFNINLIQRLEVLEESFDPDQRGFELEQHLAEGFDGVRSLPIMDVTLQIRNPTALWARDQFFHPTQTIDDIDGGIEIRFRSGGSEAIIARVLSLGRDCTVIAPDELRTRVADEAQAIANHYTTSP